MVRIITILSLFVLVLSWGVKTRILEDNITVVPSNCEVFEKKSLFEKTLLNIIDTSCIYIEAFSYLTNGKDFKRIDKKVYYRTDYHTTYYKFYSNGCFNYFFALDTDFYKFLKTDNLNPKISGHRGVFYKKDKDVHLELFTIVGYNFKTTYGINSSIVEIRGDTLFRKSKFDLKYVNVYVRKKLPKEFLVYKPDW